MHQDILYRTLNGYYVVGFLLIMKLWMDGWLFDSLIIRQKGTTVRRHHRMVIVGLRRDER
jgi:hypothetical protein